MIPCVMSPKDKVLHYYPKAMCELKPNGKKYYQICNGENLLGQGKTRESAWKSACRNMDN